MDNLRKLELAKELHRRKKLKEYEDDFALFASEQVRILTKDVSKGFVPFKLNRAQEIITEKLEKQRKETGRVRAIILKARQQGISTYCAGRVFWKTYFTPLSRSVVLAHDSATSDALFMMSRNIIDNMPKEYSPGFLKSNAKEIQFEHNKAGYRLYTAGSPEAGRGTTPTILHASEVAFWQHDEKILAGLFQGVSSAEGTEVILESTANGATGEFYRLWKGAERGENEYVPIFLPWFVTPEYRREAPEGFERSEQEQKLAEEYDLDDDQLYWRRLKIGEGGELKFRQEYPSNPDEAFIVSGSNVFNMEILHAIKPQMPVTKRELELATGMWNEHSEGSLEIWQYPNWQESYVIGADVAMGVGQDYSCAVVMNSKREICALYKNRYIDPSNYGDLLFYLGRYYNNALLAVESNSIGLATLSRIDQMNYVNLYKQTKIQNVDKSEGERLGFRTTAMTKPAVIGLLKNAIDQQDILIPSAYILQELKDFVQTETGRQEAADGCHDDSVMALAISCEVLRTHGHMLMNDRVSWKDRVGSFQQDNTNWM